MDRESRIKAYREVRSKMNDLLVAMMADMIKIDQKDNRVACQRIRVNSIKFKKVALMFRKLSMEMELKKW